MRLRYRTIKDPAVQGRITVDEVMQAVRALELERQSKSKVSPKSRRNGSNVAGKTTAKGRIRAAIIQR